jgi:hypothetical protein
MPENFTRNLQQGITNLQNAPANFVANVQAIPQQVQTAVTQQPQQTQAPQPQLNFDRNSYNASIAQQESGNRPNIGYHDRTKSTAFGSFGITAPAYADARRVDPSLPEDITQATQEQQTRAHNIITDNNARFLQSKGVEATPGALSAAHLLGAGGLHKFFTQKDEQGRPYLSPQAQAANGGYDNLARIVNGRLNGMAVPSSGAAGRPTAMPGEGVAVATGQGVQGTQTVMGPLSPEAVQQQAQNEIQNFQQYAQTQLPNSYDEFGTPVYSAEAAKLQSHVDRFNTASGDADAMMALGADKTVPDWMRRRARESVADLVNQERNQNQAQTAMVNLGPNDMAKVLTRPGSKEGNTVGDWLQYLLFKHVGLNDLANAKGEELGIGHKWATAYIQDAKGNDVPVEVQTSASGKLLKGVMAGTTTALTPEQMTMAAGAIQNADNLKTAQTQATHAFTATQQALMKQREALAQRGADEATMASRGLDLPTIQRKAQEAGKAVIDNARRQYRPQGTTNVVNANTPGYAMVNGELVNTGTADQALAGKPTGNVPAAGAITATTAKKGSILDNWSSFLPNESTANFDKRQQYTPEDIEAEAKQLVAGDKTIKDITGRDAGLLRHYASARAKELDPTWSATDSDARRDALKKWTNPDSNVAKQVRSHITASNSIQDVKQAFEALQNGNLPLFNDIRNTFRTNTGSDLPINAKTGAMLLGPEIIKSIIPGGGGVTERLEAQHLMGVNLSPDQQKAVFKILEDFQGNSLKALETDWTRAKLPKDQFRERVLGGSPAAQELYDAATAHQAQQAARRAGLNNVPSQAEIDAELKRRGLK